MYGNTTEFILDIILCLSFYQVYGVFSMTNVDYTQENGLKVKTSLHRELGGSDPGYKI